MGHKIRVEGFTTKDYDFYFGGVNAVLVDPDTGDLFGGADHARRGSVAVGY